MNDTLFDKAFVKVKLLSTIFRTNENRYLSPAYQEAEVRKNRQICPAKLQQSRIDRLVYDLYLGEIERSIGASKLVALLDSHLLPSDTKGPLKNDQFETFLDARQELIWQKIQEVTG